MNGKRSKCLLFCFFILLFFSSLIFLKEKPYAAGECQQWTATNEEHVAAGRAFTQEDVYSCDGETETGYYASGSNDPLGYSADGIVILYSNDDGQTYYKGTCPGEAECQSWTATNDEHVDADRAYTQEESLGCSTITTYYAVGSDEEIGTDGSDATTLMTTDYAIYSVGSCPVQ